MVSIRFWVADWHVPIVGNIIFISLISDYNAVSGQMHSSIIEWFLKEVKQNPGHFDNQAIIEVGSCDVNGSVRPIIETFCTPKKYIGVDITPGRYVDFVLDARDLLNHFGKNCFDVVLSTETLEHTSDWRKTVGNIKEILKESGLVFITTRSRGYPYHGYPHDYWRYEKEDMQHIFSDFRLISLLDDPQEKGVFLKAQKTSDKHVDLNEIALYSVCTGKRTKQVTCRLSLCRKSRLLARKYGIGQVS